MKDIVVADALSDSARPLDSLEQFFLEQGYEFDRPEPDELVLNYEGMQGSYRCAFDWMEDLQSLHYSCGVDLTVPPHKLAEVKELIQLINEQLWIGHFDLWKNDHILLFRHSHLMQGGGELNTDLCSALLELGIETCDLYLPAFHFVIATDSKAREVLNGILFETKGEA